MKRAIVMVIDSMVSVQWMIAKNSMTLQNAIL